MSGRHDTKLAHFCHIDAFLSVSHSSYGYYGGLAEDTALSPHIGRD